MTDPDLPADTQPAQFAPEVLATFEQAAPTGSFTFTSSAPCGHEGCYIDPAAAEQVAWHVYGFTCAVLRHQWDKTSKPPKALAVKVTVVAE